MFINEISTHFPYSSRCIYYWAINNMMHKYSLVEEITLKLSGVIKYNYLLNHLFHGYFRNKVQTYGIIN